MTGRQPKATSPLIRSSTILRAIATTATFTSLAGMTAFASTHVQNPAAPLKPTASTTSAAATTTRATPAPTSRTTTGQRRTQVAPSITSTNTAPRTRTKSS